MNGKVFFVGAGPGDPDLITVKGLRCIQTSDVILYDRLANPELLKYAQPHAELIYCGKHPNHHMMAQEQINELIAQKALEGKLVTRLKGGDPCIFGRVAEEAEILVENGIAYEIVPGITSGIAAPAYAGISVTQRKVATTFTMVTGHLCQEDTLSPEKWQALATGTDTIAFYMGMGNIAYLCEELIHYGKNPETPVAVISWGTSAEQRTVTGCLTTIATTVQQHKVPNPAIILIGEVVRMRDKLAWFEEKTG
ncbi:uroporphyrinogen-III C-methyltransferase [Paenibacillus sp. UNC451MF]|uniref:uroporphyrinogen-III C-methyltransferase n=1 Tax=Paenibacillus sp. UNC451MF TaxID=1449063 RepID=UPI000491C1E7|nr:uroporphyrinogen-III C-methyltransferase [Paenibacillus sp. UNC451MF]